MKKIISAILAASLSLSCVLTSAQASGRMESITNALSSNEIHILYNDTVVAYEDVKPVNTEGRVMIPFRAALESMGAAVEYDDATRTVTAAKGDITITFALMDDTIYINNGGAESTITMDVPMIIVQDRVLVPIRFMSNALGMQVGWDGDTETVVITDYDEYFEKLSDVAPNLTALSKLDSSNLNKSSVTFDLTSKLAGAEIASISGNADTVSNNDSGKMSGNFSVKSDELSFDNATVDAVYKDGVIYIKTDVVTKIIEGSPDLNSLNTMVKDNWFSVDIAEFLSMVIDDENSTNMIKAALSSDEKADMETLLMSAVTTDGDAVFSEVLSLAAMLDMYEAMDKYIVITPKDNGYNISVNITPEDLKTMTGAEEGMANISGSVYISVDNDGTKQTTDIKLELNDTVSSIVTNTISFTLSGKSEEAKNAEAIEIPENSVDLMNFVRLLGL